MIFQNGGDICSDIKVCSKNKAFLPCLSGEVLDFRIFYTHKYKIFLLITFFKIFRND